MCDMHPAFGGPGGGVSGLQPALPRRPPAARTLHKKVGVAPRTQEVGVACRDTSLVTEKL